MFDAPDTLKGFVGEEDGFDPLKLSTLFDMVRCSPGPEQPQASSRAAAAAVPHSGAQRPCLSCFCSLRRSEMAARGRDQARPHLHACVHWLRRG